MKNSQNTRFEKLYARALRLYPAGFCDAYALAMRQALHDALADRTLSRRALLPILLRDFITSLTKEHLAMLRETYGRPALMFNALVLTALATVLALALYAIPQQLLRMGANDPQLQLAGDTAAQLEQGTAPAAAIPSGHVDMETSLSPFVIAYDEQGSPLASQATLDGKVPVPPKGVFEYALKHGEDRPTWSPRRGIRMATVVRRVAGSHPGFVLAGRSLNEVETRISHVGDIASFAWLLMLVVIVAGTLIFGQLTRQKPTAA